jgi:hypothetical protein
MLEIPSNAYSKASGRVCICMFQSMSVCVCVILARKALVVVRIHMHIRVCLYCTSHARETTPCWHALVCILTSILRSKCIYSLHTCKRTAHTILTEIRVRVPCTQEACACTLLLHMLMFTHTFTHTLAHTLMFTHTQASAGRFSSDPNEMPGHNQDMGMMGSSGYDDSKIHTYICMYMLRCAHTYACTC